MHGQAYYQARHNMQYKSEGEKLVFFRPPIKAATQQTATKLFKQAATQGNLPSRTLSYYRPVPYSSDSYSSHPQSAYQLGISAQLIKQNNCSSAFIKKLYTISDEQLFKFITKNAPDLSSEDTADELISTYDELYFAMQKHPGIYKFIDENHIYRLANTMAKLCGLIELFPSNTRTQASQEFFAKLGKKILNQVELTINDLLRSPPTIIAYLDRETLLSLFCSANHFEDAICWASMPEKDAKIAGSDVYLRTMLATLGKEEVTRLVKKHYISERNMAETSCNIVAEYVNFSQLDIKENKNETGNIPRLKR